MNLLAPIYGRQRVKNIESDDVARLINRDDRAVVLVDVRSDPEIAVSMIPGAITRSEFYERRREHRDKLIIVYCTVGGRSLLFAQQCDREGFDVVNYGGSILAWCEAGNALVTPSGAATQKVHTHNRFFKAPMGYERDLASKSHAN